MYLYGTNFTAILTAHLYMSDSSGLIKMLPIMGGFTPRDSKSRTALIRYQFDIWYANIYNGKYLQRITKSLIFAPPKRVNKSDN